MSALLIALILVVSLGLMSVASEFLTRSLERVGGRLRFSEGLLGLVMASYVSVLAVPATAIGRLPIPKAVRSFFDRAVGHAHRSTRGYGGTRAIWHDGVIIVVALVTIIVSSILAVRYAVSLAERWHLHPAIMGTLVLAALTSVPNVLAAVQLAREERGAAVVSESRRSCV